MLPSGRQRLLNNRLHWAKFYMSKAGLIHHPVVAGSWQRMKGISCSLLILARSMSRC
jgi:restriction endonuclease Mrr